MKYSAVPQSDGKIVRWQIEGQQSFGQFPYLPVKRYERITVEADFDEHNIRAAIEECPGQCVWLPFTPDTPPILHRGKGGPPEFCEKSTQINSGWPHIWEPDGDGQWMVCHLCGVRRRA